MRGTVENAGDEWDHARARQAMTRILRYRDAASSDDQTEDVRGTLLERLATSFAVDTQTILSIVDLTRAFRHPDRRSHYRTVNRQPAGLAVNMTLCDDYRDGGEFPEYAGFADDTIIGSRWVAHEDEALLMTLGHELAHHVVALRELAADPLSSSDEAHHGPAFQETYRVIRQFAINPILDEFAASTATQGKKRHVSRLASKLQALRKMAEDPSSNRHEAERAVNQLSHLLAKHGIEDLDRLDFEAPQFIERFVPVASHSGYKPLLHIAFDIGRFCGVETLIHSSRWLAGTLYTDWDKAPAQTIGYFGAPGDVAMAVYLSELIYLSLYRELQAYRQSDAYRRERQCGRHPGTLRSSFRTAFMQQLCYRLRGARESVENAWLTDTPSAQALVTQRAHAIQQALQQRYAKIGSARQRRVAGVRSRSALSAGRAAANRFNLNRPVTSPQQKQLPKPGH